MGEKKPPPCNKTSVYFQTSHAKVFMVVIGNVYVFFSHFFVKTTYLLKKYFFFFPLMRFSPALSVVAAFQLKVEDSYFFALRTPVFVPHLSV